MKQYTKLILGMMILMITVSCGTIRKFTQAPKNLAACQQEKASLEGKFTKAQAQLKEHETALAKMVQELKQARQESERLKNDMVYLQAELKDLREQHEALEVSTSSKAKGNEKEIRQLLADLQKNKELQIQKEDELKRLAAQLDERQKKVELMSLRLDDKEKRVNELEKILFTKDSIVHALRKSVNDALLGYIGKGLSVNLKNGKVYVSMDESLLFASASWQVGSEGVEAIKKLGKVLHDNSDIAIMVEGHTDNVPFTGSGQVKDNWDLSVMRATSVAKILLENSGIAPSRVATAGRSEYNPVDPANSKEARAKNRRTEIILTPKLDELFKIIESN